MGCPSSAGPTLSPYVFVIFLFVSSIPSTWIWDASQDLLGGTMCLRRIGRMGSCSPQQNLGGLGICRLVLSFEVGFEHGVRPACLPNTDGASDLLGRLDVRVLQALVMSLA